MIFHTMLFRPKKKCSLSVERFRRPLFLRGMRSAAAHAPQAQNARWGALAVCAEHEMRVGDVGLFRAEGSKCASTEFRLK